MNLDKKILNVKKPYLLVDSSYVSFHRFFSTLIWYNNVYPNEEIGEDYDWLSNEIFMKHFDETYMKNLLKFKNMYNIPNENIIVVRDCPRETIWRMNLYKEYKATRKNTCNFKNKKYNIGNIFKHIYNKLYPQLEKQYGFKILKVDNAEADDIIAVLANKIRENDRARLVVIISNDNDYLQLVNDKTLIWSLQNKLLNTKVETTAEEILIRKILKGDESDNIPSLVGCMSEKELGEIVRDEKKLNEWFDKNPGRREMYDNNRKLIDFKFIPQEIQATILEDCKDILPQVEVEPKKNEPVKIETIEEVITAPLPAVSPAEFWNNSPIIKIKTKTAMTEIKNNIQVNTQKYKQYPRHYFSNYVNYRNYGNPHLIKNIGMPCSFHHNRHNYYGYQTTFTINFAADDYY